MPLVLRWDGQLWQTADTSGLSDDPALLMAAWTAAGGRATVAGSCHRDSTRFEGLTARSGGGGWTTNALTALPGQTGLTAVDGVEGTGARLAGSTVYIGAAVRTCGPVGQRALDADARGRAAGPSVARRAPGHPRASSSRAGPSLVPRRVTASGRSARPSAPVRGRPPARIQYAAAGPWVFVMTPRPRAASQLDHVGCGRRRLRRRRRGRHLPRTARVAGAAPARPRSDVRRRRRRLRHRRPPRLRGRRRGCSGFPDLYCSIGGRRGTGSRRISSGIDPLPGATLDPVRRSRCGATRPRSGAAFLDVDGDGHRDLFLGRRPSGWTGCPRTTACTCGRRRPLRGGGGIGHRPHACGPFRLDR